ncbi:MAG TPA: tryptophan 2,3-dioxygenase family protein [Acidimicrobiales bacterium]|jgi:tryptophan 2,3-dioxygenase|nr:tryptophan 2,3-dioxygenase family protein [Acidimicrobiales bacterium]
MAEASQPLYYHDYLQLDRLLSCQQPASERLGRPAHDELLFIVVHQAYELWFKQILHELDAVLDIFSGVVADRDMLRAVGHLQRVAEIERLLVHQVDVLETMTPLDFLDFRDALVPASGFQSLQFRLIENRLGVDPASRPLIAGSVYTTRFSSDHRRRIERTETGPTLFSEVQAWLERTPFLALADFPFWHRYRGAVESSMAADRRAIEEDPRLGDDERARRLEAFDRSTAQHTAVFDPDRYAAHDPGYRPRLSHRAFEAALLINLYRDEPVLQLPYRLLATLMDVDEGLTNWRYRHALMVRRMIGGRMGTGGTSGYDYLYESAERVRVFNDLFTLSTYLVPRAQIPPLPADVERAMGFYLSSKADGTP